MAQISQKFYKGVEIVYNVAAVPEVNTTTSWRLSSVVKSSGSSNISLRRLDNTHFGLTCYAEQNYSFGIYLYIAISDEHTNIDETRYIYFTWVGTYVAPDKVISTYDRANLLSVAALRNYATYNITEKNSLAGGITIDPEKDGVIQGLRLSKYNDYDDEYNLGTNLGGRFIQNPLYSDFGNYPEVINDNGEYKITVDSKIPGGGSMYDMWFNNVDSATGEIIPPIIPDPSYTEYNYPIVGPAQYTPQLMGLKVEVAPDVFLYCNQYNETSDNQVLSWTTIDKSNRTIYKDVEFRDENNNLIPNTDTIGVMLKTKNFILKSTKNIRKVRIWTSNGDMGTTHNYLSQIDADKGTIQVIDKHATYTGTGTSSFPQDQWLHIWEGNSKHIKFSLSNGYLINNGASTPTVGDFRTTIHSYTQENQTTPTDFGTDEPNPKVYLCDSNGEPTSNYYDGILHNCAWSFIDYSTGSVLPTQVMYNMNSMDSTTITLIQVETD